MAALGKDRLIYTEASPTESDSVGAYLRVQGGTVLTRTTVGAKESLDVKPSNTFAEDSAHVSGDIGGFVMGVRNDANAVLTSTDGDYSPIAVDSAGRLKTITAVTINAEKVEDVASASGDTGSFILAVRKDADTGSLVSTDGDYAAVTVDATDRLKVNVVGNVADSAVDAGNPVKQGFRAVTGALSNSTIANNDRVDAISDDFRRQYINDSPNIDAAAVAVSVDTTAGGVAIPTTALGGRRRIIVQNLGTVAVFVGKSGVTAVTGLRVGASATLALEIGPNIALFAIAGSGAQDVRVFELA